MKTFKEINENENVIKDFKIYLEGDWYSATLIISDTTLKGMTRQFCGIFPYGINYPQIIIKEPEEYNSLIWDNSANAFLTYDEHLDVKKKIDEITLPYKKRNGVYLSDEELMNIF